MKRSLSALLLLLVPASLALAQPQGGGRGFRGFGPPSNARLLAIDEVRTEIGVKDDQGPKIDQLLADARERLSSGGGFNFQDFQNLSADEREKRMAEFRKRAEEVNKETDEKLAKILDAKQMERLTQLRNQSEGPSALARPEVAEKVGLSKEQQDKIAKIQEELRSGGFDNYRERRQQADDDIVALLNDEQKTKWNELKGKEFTFPERGRGQDGGGDRQRPGTRQRDN